MSRTMIIAAVTGLAACGQACAQTPEGAVRALYAADSIPTEPAAISRVFAADLAAALIKDSSIEGEVGEIDGDYRYDAQDFEIKGLRFQTVSSGAGEAVVRASFSNFGKARSVTYRLCRRAPGDWRIRNITLPWGDLRSVLKVPPAKGC